MAARIVCVASVVRTKLIVLVTLCSGQSIEGRITGVMGDAFESKGADWQNRQVFALFGFIFIFQSLRAVSGSLPSHHALVPLGARFFVLG